MTIPTLRPYQLDLVQRVREARVKGARIIVVQAATGSGKSSVLAHITEQAVIKDVPVLIMVHRRKLVDQISERLNQFVIPHAVMMANQTMNTSAQVQVASKDTLLSRCVRNEWLGMPKAGLICVDEGHHAANPKGEYRNILEAYPRATILLFTATPVGPDGQGMGPWAQALVCAAPTSQLVKDGFLTPVRVIAPDRKRKGRKFLRGIAGDLVESWKTYGENRPTVLFCSRVKHSQDAVRAYNEAGIPAIHVDCDTPDDERDRAYDDVARGKIKILSNVGIVGEGVDVPELKCVQWFCQVNGRVKWCQGNGRVMRPVSGIPYGIVLDHSGGVFQHGFPDEDMEWTLDGNADAQFAGKHKDGETEQAKYCKRCELVYHSSPTCPQCGRAPVMPPRSVFAPPPVDASHEILVEADRQAGVGVFSEQEKIGHWFRCLRVACKRNGTFAMASVIFKNKYKEWPGASFPMMPAYRERNRKVAEVYPEFASKGA